MGNWTIVWGLAEGENLGVEAEGFYSESQAFTKVADLRLQDPTVIYSVVPAEEIA